MLPAEYQARVSASNQYGEWCADDYMALALCEATGAVCGELAKLMRDRDHSADELHHLLSLDEVRLPLLEEIGDVCCLLATIATRNGFEFGSMSQCAIPSSIVSAARWLSVAASAFRDNATRYKVAHMTAKCFDLTTILGSNLQDVFDLSVSKLESRAARGTLGGSGGTR